MTKDIIPTIRVSHQHRTVKGYYRATVMEGRKDGDNQSLVPVSSTDWKPNLILDVGLDKIAHMPWGQVFQFCVAGDKVNPRPPKVTDTQLEQPALMNSFWLLGTDYCGSARDGNVFKLWRTFDFYKVTTNMVVTELGFKESPAATQLFSRVVLNPPQKLHAGQFLRVEYELNVELSPTTASAPDPVPVISGDPAWVTSTDDREMLQLVGLAGVDSDTSMIKPFDTGGFCNEVFAPGTRSFGPGYGYVNRWQNGPAITANTGYLHIDNISVDPYGKFGPLYDYIFSNTPATQYRNPHEFWNYQFQYSNQYDPGATVDPAALTAVLEAIPGHPNGFQRIASVTVDYEGSGYTGTPVITFQTSSVTGGTATGTVVMDGDSIDSVTITNSGLYVSSVTEVNLTLSGGSAGSYRGTQFTASGANPKWINYYTPDYIRDMAAHHGYGVSFPDGGTNGLRTITATPNAEQSGTLSASAIDQLPDPAVKFMDIAATNTKHALNVNFFDPALGVPQANCRVFHTGRFQDDFPDSNVYSMKSCVPFMLGTNGAIITSPTGTNWTARNSKSVSWLTDVAYDGTGVYAAVGYAGTIFKSTDSIAWVKQSSLTINRLEAVCWAGDRFLAVGDIGTILTSTDGHRWETQVSGTTQFLTGCAHKVTGDIQVVVGREGYIAKSTNQGETWVQWNGGDVAVLSLTVVGGEITVVTVVHGGAGYLSAPVITVADELPNPNDDELVAGSGAILTAVLTAGVVTSVTITDGGSGYHQAVGSVGTFATVASPQNASNAELLDVIFAGTKFVAVGESGLILTSTDGATWTKQWSGTGSTDVASNLCGIGYNGTNLYVAVGASGTILTSPDAVTWTAKTSGTTATLFGIAFGGAVYVATGGDVNVNTGLSTSVILSSADTTTWTARTSTVPRVFEATIYANSQFVTVGGIGAIAPVPEPIPGKYYWSDYRGTNVAGSSAFLSASDRNFAAFGSAVDLTTNANASTCEFVELPLRLEPYVSGTYERTKYVLFDTLVGNGTWKWVGVGPTSLSIIPAGMDEAPTKPGYLYKFDEPNEKLDTHQLKLAFTYSWSRKED